ncbi:YoaK family protein [Mucilaginibacter sp. UYCu711]|uniref:YoaK family protein n=1 Tax=Mucilaginibacter sp. UYCu711 TaxID=3156339 RepID=UPI003D1AEC6B
MAQNEPTLTMLNSFIAWLDSWFCKFSRLFGVLGFNDQCYRPRCTVCRAYCDAGLKTARVVALWMFLFLAGAFISGLIVSKIGRNQRFSYAIPLIIEMVILLGVATLGFKYDNSLVGKEIFAGSLLFAMGLQNSLVSLVSGSVVRATHLTGTFTDLGIELAQLLQHTHQENIALISKIKLRVAIILFFMTGALAGAYMFRYYHFYAFFLPLIILFYTLMYDIFRIVITRYYRRFYHRQKKWLPISDKDHF